MTLLTLLACQALAHAGINANNLQPSLNEEELNLKSFPIPCRRTLNFPKLGNEKSNIKFSSINNEGKKITNNYKNAPGGNPKPPLSTHFPHSLHFHPDWGDFYSIVFLAENKRLVSENKRLVSENKRLVSEINVFCQSKISHKN